MMELNEESNREQYYKNKLDNLIKKMLHVTTIHEPEWDYDKILRDELCNILHGESKREQIKERKTKLKSLSIIYNQTMSRALKHLTLEAKYKLFYNL